MTNLGYLSDGPVKLEQIVRPLQFREEVSDLWWSAGSYRIESCKGGGFSARVADPQSRAFRTLTFGVSFDEAKAAAQAHHLEAMSSALNLDPLLSEIKRMREEVCAPELANEIWETLFNETKDCVPEELTNELLAKVAEALLSGYSIQRRARHG